MSCILVAGIADKNGLGSNDDNCGIEISDIDFYDGVGIDTNSGN